MPIFFFTEDERAALAQFLCDGIEADRIPLTRALEAILDKLDHPLSRRDRSILMHPIGQPRGPGRPRGSIDWTKVKRDQDIVASYRRTGSYRQTASEFGLSP